MDSTKKIVYVLVSEPSDHYAEMALLSIQCARKYSPKVNIELVVDKKTDSLLNGYRGKVKTYIDKLHVIDIDGENNKYISRMLKTQLRTFIEGDYLYVDIDAIPVSELSDIFEIECDIAMVHDLDKPKDIVEYMDPTNTIYKEWVLPEKYFNSGVMLVKDTQEAKAFFLLWHKLWKDFIETGLHIDQPSLNEAIRNSPINIVELPDEYNVYIGRSVRAKGLRNPKIYHYFTLRFNSRDDIQFIRIVKSMKINEVVNWDLVEDIIRTKFPWTDTESLRLNWNVRNYMMMPRLLIKKILRI